MFAIHLGISAAKQPKNGANLLHFTPLALALAMLSACGGGTPRPVSTPAAPLMNMQGLERVIGKDAPTLANLFGEPELDIREGTALKYQFAGPVCVLDAYLYPPRPGSTPVTTYVEARTPTGADFDRASCVAALTRRPQAR